MLVLTVIQGPDRGRRFELPDNEPQLLGRSSEALPLSDNTVSRRHAELTPDGGEWYIRDLESQNGTYLNGSPIRERQLLKAGDQIRVGQTVVVYGRADLIDDVDFFRMLGARELDASVDRALPSNEDSVILAVPEPRLAAIEHLRVIYRLTTMTAQAGDRAAMAKAALELIFNEFKPERGVILLADESRALRPVVFKYRTPPRDRDDAQFFVSHTILQHVVRKHEGVLSTNAMSDPRFAAGDSVQRYSVRSAICSPIRHRDRTFGAIYIDSSMANYTFTEDQLALMNAIGQHTGIALSNLELQAETLQSERLAAIGQTVASLSHSIKNILQGLRGGADLVDMGLKKEDLKVVRSGWDIQKRNLDRIVSLTTYMLAFSRQRQIEVELTRPGPIVEECAQLLEGVCSERGIALIADVDPEMPPVPLDASLFHQAMMNLLTNAVEAVAPSTGVVTVRAIYHPLGALGAGSPPRAEFRVIDNGPGVPEDMRERIFQPFQTTKGTRGTGLGLAVTRRIVEEHGGRIAIESEEGKGAEFVMIFPADTKADPAATAQAGAAETEAEDDFTLDL